MIILQTKNNKILLESQRSEVKECFTLTTTRHNSKQSFIHHLQSCHFPWFFVLCATEFPGAHLPCSHVNPSAFLRHHSTYLQDNEKILLCGVARAFGQISENGQRSKKFAHPWYNISDKTAYKVSDNNTVEICSMFPFGKWYFFDGKQSRSTTTTLSLNRPSEIINLVSSVTLIREGRESQRIALFSSGVVAKKYCNVVYSLISIRCTWVIQQS